MSKWDRVHLGGAGALGGCCVGEVQARVQLAAEGERLGCGGCGRVLAFRGGAWSRPPGFADRHGPVQWSPRLGDRYPRGGACEVCGMSAAEVAALYAEAHNRHLGVLMFDHCHVHGWVRGMVCLGCNNAMVLHDKGIGWAAGLPRFAALAARCPDCARASAA